MGLDSFAMRSHGEEDPTPEDSAAFEEAQIELCGGLLSGGGTSFRGKVYAGLVEAVTGESLYEEWIPPDRVGKMYEAFRDFDPGDFDGYFDERFGDLETQIRNLREFFRVCADRGLGIEGWW